MRWAVHKEATYWPHIDLISQFLLLWATSIRITSSSALNPAQLQRTRVTSKTFVNTPPKNFIALIDMNSTSDKTEINEVGCQAVNQADSSSLTVEMISPLNAPWGKSVRKRSLSKFYESNDSNHLENFLAGFLAFYFR